MSRRSQDVGAGIVIHDGSLVALVGCSGSGKSTFTRAHFDRYQVVSSDACRGMVSDDGGNQLATADAFEVLYAIVDQRLSRALLTIIDSTNVTPFARERIFQSAAAHTVPVVAIVLDVPLKFA